VKQTHDSAIRSIIFTHLIAVGVCLGFTLADRRLLISPRVSQLFVKYGVLLFFPAVLSWWVCPLLLIIILMRPGISVKTRVLSVAAETLLCVLQIYVLLPAVM
jgi:hypothetical protein